MRTGERLASLLNVEPGEGRLVALLFAASFCVGSANVFVYAAAYALFLTEFDAQALPYVYIGISVVVTLFSYLYMQLGQRLSFSDLLLATGVFLVLLLLGLRLGLGLTGARWLVFSLPVLGEVIWALANLVFWNLAGYLFNVRQGKRLFGFIGAGEQLAALAGGLVIPLLVVTIGTPNLLFVGATACAGILALTVHISRAYKGTISAALQEEAAEEKQKASRLQGNRYILLIFTLFALGIVAYYAIDNIFYIQAEIQYPGEEQMAAFIGLFSGLVGLLTLLSRAFLTGPLISRYGVRAGLLCTPALLLACGLLVAGLGTVWGSVAILFWLVALLQLTNLVFTESVDVHAINVLYQPLPPSPRIQTQTMVEGIIYSLAVGLAGISLTLLTGVFALGPLQLTYFLLLVLLGWMAVAMLLSQEYPRQLVQALARRWLEPVQWPFLDEGTSVTILEREIQGPNAATVIYALNGLQAIKPELACASLPSLLDHPSPEVRKDVLVRMRKMHLSSALPAVLHCLDREPVAAVRGAALRTLVALDESDDYEVVGAYLDDPQPEVQLGAIAGLLESGGIEGVLAGGQRLLALARSGDPAQRALAARVLGEVGLASFYRPLVPLLQDKDLEVQRQALLAAGQIKATSLWPLVADKLAMPETRRAAISALINGGDAVVPVLIDVAGQREQPPQAMAQLATVLGRIGGEPASAWLKSQMTFPEAQVRTAVLQALSRCGYQASGADYRLVQDLIRTEASHAAGALAALVDLGHGGPVELLRDALGHTLDQIRVRILTMLSFIYDRQLVLQARDNLSLHSSEKRAYALEVLDVQVSQELKAICFPLLDDLPPEQGLRLMQARFPQPHLERNERLKALVMAPPGSFSAWTTACALYAAGSLAAPQLAPAVSSKLSSPDPLVRETAAWALGQLDGTQCQERLEPLSLESNPDAARTAVGSVIDRRQEGSMLSTLEKTIMLKKAGVFAETPGEALAAVAALQEEVHLGADETIFEAGDLGDCMYVIVKGRVRVHDQGRTLNHLDAGEIFGEMALLDPEPRMASVTAVANTHLLRLDQEPFYELLEDRPEVVRGIIRVLCQRLRARAGALGGTGPAVTLNAMP